MVANWGWNTTATTTQEFYTIGTTNTSQPIGWNGGVVQIVGAPPPKVPVVEGPLDWLRRRVDECRVGLAA